MEHTRPMNQITALLAQVPRDPGGRHYAVVKERPEIVCSYFGITLDRIIARIANEASLKKYSSPWLMTMTSGFAACFHRHSSRSSAAADLTVALSESWHCLKISKRVLIFNIDATLQSSELRFYSKTRAEGV